MRRERPPRSAVLSWTTRSAVGSPWDQNHRTSAVSASPPARMRTRTRPPARRGSGGGGGSATEELLRPLRRLGAGQRGHDALERLLRAPVVLHLLVGVVDAPQRLL